VELLVVIAIIGLLVALLLPAVQAARESARRVQCRNNLKQLAVALHNYHDPHRTFPAAIYVRSGENGIDGSVLRENWVIGILPHLEQQALYDQFNRALPISDSVNWTPRGTPLSPLLCPSDSGSNRTVPCSLSGGNWARGNYGANSGLCAPNDTAGWDDNLQRGVMGLNKSQRMGDILDGTANTFLLLEMRAGLHPLDRRGSWAMALCGSSSLCRHGSNYVNRPNECAFGADDLRDCDQLVAAAGVGAMQQACMGCFTQSGGSYSVQATARSLHQGGIFVALADASVQFVSDSIETGYQTVGFDPNPAKFLTWQRLIVSSDGFPLAGKPW
jgi:type II secretory pathway pseudopilin PulG